jgi:hypothetical protein
LHFTYTYSHEQLSIQSKDKYSLLNEKALTVPTSTTETLEHPTTESVQKGRQAEGVAITTIVVIVSGSLLL